MTGYPDNKREHIEREISATSEMRKSAQRMRAEGNLDAARTLYREIADTLERLSNECDGALRARVRDGLAGAYFGMAKCLVSPETLDRASECCERSEEIRRSLERSGARKRTSGIGERRAWNLRELGRIYIDLGKGARRKAITAYRQSIRLFRRELTAGRLSEAGTREFGYAVLELAYLLKDSKNGAALKVLREFSLLLQTHRRYLQDEELMNQLGAMEADLARSESPLVLRGLARLGCCLTVKSALWCVAIAALVFIGLVDIAAVGPLAVLRCGVMAAGFFAVVGYESWSLRGQRARIGTAGAIVATTLGVVVSLCEPTLLPSLVVAFGGIGAAVLAVERLLKTGWAQRWRERHLLHAKAIQRDRATARKVAEAVPRALRWLLVRSREGQTEFRPYVCHISAEVLVFRDFSHWVGELFCEWVGAALTHGSRPPDRRSRRPERNVSQPWAGRRIFYALLPRGAHASAA